MNIQEIISDTSITTEISIMEEFADVSMIFIDVTIPNEGTGIIKDITIRQCCMIGKNEYLK